MLRIAALAASASTMLALALLAGCGDAGPPQPRLSGVVLDGKLDEISGIAASGRFTETFWVIQDGGNDALLHAISRRGSRLATVRVAGVHNTDWEDIAAFTWQGKHWLLIPDTGDNGGMRRTLQLHVVPEPDLVDGSQVRPAWSIAFRWPDGPRDCEAVAVDVAAGEVLLISKRRHPPELFVLPLRPGTAALQVARRVGFLACVAQPDAESLRSNPRSARVRYQVTAADISPDDNTLAVLTYSDLLLYRRTRQATWEQAVATPPRVNDVPWLPQAEAL